MNDWVSGPFFLHCIFHIAERFSCGMEAGITEKEVSLFAFYKISGS